MLLLALGKVKTGAGTAQSPQWIALKDELSRYGVVLAVLIVMVAVLSIIQPAFLSKANLLNLLNTNSIVFITSIGMTFVLLTGGIDLSVGSTIAFACVLLAPLLHGGVPAPLAVVIALLAGGGIGLLNGYLIGRWQASFFVVTIGTMALVRGIVFAWTNGQTRYIDDFPLIHAIGDGTVLGVPTPVLLMLIIAVVGQLVLSFTHYGRNIYAVGGNEEAARIAGVKVHGVKLSVYVIAGVLAALAGVIQAGRLNASAPTVATGTELDVAAAVLLGGNSFKGGVGSVVGTVVGSLFIAVLQNGLTIVGLSHYWQQVMTGLVLLVAVVLELIRRRGRPA